METLSMVLELLLMPVTDGVHMAIAWWAPMAISAGAGLLGQLTGAGRRREAGRETQRLQGSREGALGGMDEIVQMLMQRGEDVQEGRSVEDLYGRQIQALTDRTAADVGSARSSLERAMMAGGGDITGQGALLASELGAQGQRSIMDVISEYTERADIRNLRESQRADQLFTQALSGQRALGGIYADLEGAARGREDRMRTADRQLFVDTLGMGTSLSGQLF